MGQGLVLELISSAIRNIWWAKFKKKNSKKSYNFKKTLTLVSWINSKNVNSLLSCKVNTASCQIIDT